MFTPMPVALSIRRYQKLICWRCHLQLHHAFLSVFCTCFNVNFRAYLHTAKMKMIKENMKRFGWVSRIKWRHIAMALWHRLLYKETVIVIRTSNTAGKCKRLLSTLTQVWCVLLVKGNNKGVNTPSVSGSSSIQYKLMVTLENRPQTHSQATPLTCTAAAADARCGCPLNVGLGCALCNRACTSAIGGV